MIEHRLSPRPLPAGHAAAVAEFVSDLLSLDPSVPVVYITAIPAFIEALRSDLESEGVVCTDQGRTLTYASGSLRIHVSPLDSWNDWWDDRTLYLEGGAGEIWVEGSGDVAPLGLSPSQLELYAVLRHTDSWSPVEARAAALALAPAA